MEKTNVITFEPILKQTLWGGNKIKALKHIDTDLENIGESWEISGVEGSESVVANGEFKGMKLNELVRQQKAALVGKEHYAQYGDEFPLLIKFIDACQDLSIQVHPNDEVAHRQGKKRGKTEMWYIMDSEPYAKLRCGLKKAITPEQYKEMVANDTICDAISEYNVKEGDCFFIPAGRIHSIGKGCFLTEIQQTSDVTYRIYDFKRKDKNGNYRQLHTKEAAEAINYTVEKDYQTHYTPRKDEGVTMVSCPYFTTSVYDLTEPMTLDYSELDSFVILICTKGDGKLIDEAGREYTFREGVSVLLPAWTRYVKVEGKVKFVETY